MKITLESIDQKLSDHINSEGVVWEGVVSDIREIKEQTKRTNGSIISLRLWRSYLTGGILVVAFLVIPLIVYIFTSEHYQLQSQITQLQGK